MFLRTNQRLTTISILAYNVSVLEYYKALLDRTGRDNDEYGGVVVVVLLVPLVFRGGDGRIGKLPLLLTRAVSRCQLCQGS